MSCRNFFRHLNQPLKILFVPSGPERLGHDRQFVSVTEVIPFVKICSVSSQSESALPNMILLDDDPMVRKVWELEAD